jgi:hypothetical protein
MKQFIYTLLVDKHICGQEKFDLAPNEHELSQRARDFASRHRLHSIKGITFRKIL